MVREYDSCRLETVLGNFERVLRTYDSSLIEKQLYYILHMYCGFICHYSIHGFREEYRDLRDLLGLLLREDICNPRYFIGKQESYLYDTKYRGHYVAEFVRGIIDLAEEYRERVETHFAGQERLRNLMLAEKLADELGLKLVKKERKEVMPGKKQS